VFTIETVFVLCEVRTKTTVNGLNVLPFTRQVREMGYVAPYEVSNGDTISRRWRDIGVREIHSIHVQAREAVETADDLNMNVLSDEKRNKVVTTFRLHA
jgi:hypothetical protein